MKKSFLICCLFISIISYGQTPHLQGTINLDIPKGLISCELKFSNTALNGSYTVLLNSGFNIKAHQKNSRGLYILGGTEISLEMWPGIPVYAEIESQNKIDVEKMLKKLDLNNMPTTSKPVSEIYKYYGLTI